MQRRSNTVIYAIGDVHGEARRLKKLHGHIFERHAFSFPDHLMRLVHLGDYVDRGNDSAGVLDLLISLEAKFGENTICLQGNHEAMMLAGVNNATPTAYEYWLKNGGEQTIESYRARGQLQVPREHVNWLSRLPKLHVEPRRKLIFVHAGINPETYPDHDEDIYLWTRSARFFDVETWTNPDLEDWTVIHGHTPTVDFFPDDAIASARRINIDTGAVFGGRLTAAIFAPDQQVQYIYA